MKTPLLILTLLALALAGCSDDSRAQNQSALSGPGEYVGTLPDGREVRRYRIVNTVMRDHWIYVVGRDVTVNRDERSGKTTYHEVQAVLSSP